MQANAFIKRLYKSVDDKDLSALSAFLAGDVVFRLGNLDPINGKQAVLDANEAFFNSIDAMSHTIDGVWAVGADVLCNGYVHYTRLDGSKLSLPFATILALKDGLVSDYKIYADISPL